MAGALPLPTAATVAAALAALAPFAAKLVMNALERVARARSRRLLARADAVDEDARAH